MTAATGPVRVAVGICTFRRRDALANLLDRLDDVAAATSDEVSVVVVDDDPAASARDVVVGFEHRFGGAVSYVAHGGRNLAAARNRVLQASAEHADFVALIDDDCLPHPEWISGLMDVQRMYDADIVSGHCIDKAPEGAPEWFRTEGWVDEFPQPEHGAAIEVGWIKNALVRLRAVDELGLGFEDEFGKTGGEDVMFFYRAAAKGANHRFAAGATVEETVPISRVNLRYQWLRALWYGNSAANTSAAAGRVSPARSFLQGAKVVAMSAVSLARRAVRREPLRWRFEIACALMGVGKMTRVFGVKIRHSTVNTAAARLGSG